MKKTLKTIYKILVELIPVFIMLILIWLFHQNNLLLTSLLALVLGAALWMSYQKNEWIVIVFGTSILIFVEILMVLTKAESFSNPVIFGIPLWLPLVWAYGLVVIKRIVLDLDHLKLKR